MFVYKTKGVCSTEIHLEIENDIIKTVEFVRGCPGNLVGISALVSGMNVNDAITKLKGITCGNKDTSCPDQLSKALEEYNKIA
ncbi:TIGR03905 family TSCPD domain-containing protein [Clostridium nigeriense]|uniref:TIGR03905 family TSCPD domain-containing protein n=1 Tax=Clostridium nigeriense TaxID=1805470 RepID=UPI00082A07F4|nr:TIGR03905 family TSCPD domain-containing protein [Clostridium nigeriense]